MVEIKTSRVKYIYLDVVGFTHNRTVETQIKIIAALNDIVRGCLTDLFPEIDVIYIPVGDGICICLLDSKEAYDDHITIAEEIIRRICSLYNPSVKGSYQFEVRIGINENIDNIITDINDNRNVCGSGVNYAQRIMNFGDSNHILVGRSVYDNLIPRDKYLKAFRRYIGKAKHNTDIELYQYIGGNVGALNRNEPSFFTTPERKLSKYSAYYIAHAIKNRHFIDNHLKAGYEMLALGVLLSYLAEDSVGHSNETKIKPYDNHMPSTPNNTLDEQYEYFDQLSFQILVDLYELKVSTQINMYYSYCFEPSSYCLFVNKTGVDKLKSDWSTICDEFNLQ